MMNRMRWFAPLLLISMMFVSACGIIEPTPTPTLILPSPFPIIEEETETPAPEEDVTPTLAPTTPDVDVTPTEMATATQANTPTIEVTPTLTATPFVAATPTQTATPAREAAEPFPVPLTGADDAWPLAHRDYENSRANLNPEINAASINHLDEAWRFTTATDDNLDAGISSPVVANGVVYVQDRNSNVFALDLETGELLWEHRLDLPSSAPNGPAIGYGKVFFPTGNGEIHAVDSETGEEIWTAPLDGGQRLHQPYVYNELVLTGTQTGPSVGAAAGDAETAGTNQTGFIYALNQETGEIVWQFELTAEEEDILNLPEFDSRIGVSFPPAVDTERGLGYWITGMPAPLPVTSDDPNAPRLFQSELYANSLIALDLETGQPAWTGSLNPGDMFGHSTRVSPLLVEAQVAGTERSLVVASVGSGFLGAFERDSGEVIWQIPISNAEIPGLQPVLPGEEGEAMSDLLSKVASPMAHTDGVLYLPVTVLPPDFTQGGGLEGGAGQGDQTGDLLFDLSRATGALVAVEANTSQVLWAQALPSAPIGGATVLSDMVITVTHSGQILALNRSTGQVLWQAITVENPRILPVVAGDIILLPASGLSGEFSLVALRVEQQQPASAQRTPTPSPTPTEMTPADETPVVTETPDDVIPPPATITQTPTLAPTPAIPTPEEPLPEPTPTP